MNKRIIISLTEDEVSGKITKRRKNEFQIEVYGIKNDEPPFKYAEYSFTLQYLDLK